MRHVTDSKAHDGGGNITHKDILINLLFIICIISDVQHGGILFDNIGAISVEWKVVVVYV